MIWCIHITLIGYLIGFLFFFANAAFVWFTRWIVKRQESGAGSTENRLRGRETIEGGEGRRGQTLHRQRRLWLRKKTRIKRIESEMDTEGGVHFHPNPDI